MAQHTYNSLKKKVFLALFSLGIMIAFLTGYHRKHYTFIGLDQEGSKMKCQTIEDVKRIVADKNISFIQYWFTDVLEYSKVLPLPV